MATPLSKPWLPKTSPQKILLTNAKIINVVDGSIDSNSSVLLENGQIAGVGNEYDMQIPDDVQRVDLLGKFICPGLIDSHVHISAVPGEADFRMVMMTPEKQALLRMVYVCRDMLSRGFTTVRDCGGAPFALKEACKEWLIVGPRLYICGHALSQTGGHGDFRSAHDCAECASGFVSGLGRICDGPDACLRVARDELRCGADFLKIMGSGGVVSPTDRLENNQFSPAEIQAMVLAAENCKTYVTCHAYTPEAIRIAVENGVKGIEHGNLLDRDTAELMAANDCYLTPTLVTYKTMADLSSAGFLAGDCIPKNKKVLEMGVEALRIAKAAGVSICYGSDLLGPLGGYQAQEFRLRSAALTPLDILQSATITPARMLRNDTLGQIKAGFEADILILKSNPLDDITMFERHEEEVLAVIKEGRVCCSRMAGLTGLLDEINSL